MHASVQHVNADLGRRMMSGGSGFLRTRDPWKEREAWVAYAPMPNGGLALAVVYPEDEALADARRLRNGLLTTGFLGLLGLTRRARSSSPGSISKPIVELARAAQLVADGDLEQRLGVSAPTEGRCATLMNAFNKMTRDLQMRMQELRYTTTVKERFRRRAECPPQQPDEPRAQGIFPPSPAGAEFDIPRPPAARPAKSAGDFYDFYFLDDDWLCLLIADVSGKGVPAALFMAVTKTLLKASSSRRIPIAEMVAHVNDELCEQTDSGMFVSLLYAHLNTRTGELEFCNAGHPVPYLLAADQTARPLTGAKDVAVGAMSALDYHSTRSQLAPGDAAFLLHRRRDRGPRPEAIYFYAPMPAWNASSTMSAAWPWKKSRAESSATCELSAVNANKATIFP